jgi:hypothetical protein
VKRITLIGSLILVAMIVISLVTALNMGEKSPIYAAGQVVVSPELAQDAQSVETLFVILFDPDSPMPMPLGAVKERMTGGFSGTFDFSLTKEKMLRMGMQDGEPVNYPKYLRLKARLDKDGLAGPDQPGDLVGIVENVPFGSTDVTIKIEKKIP